MKLVYLWLLLIVLSFVSLFVGVSDLNPMDLLSMTEDAVNLGVPYDRTIKRLIAVVAILVTISTALVGPIIMGSLRKLSK